MKRINTQGIADNARHVAGILVGLCLRNTTHRFDKSWRGVKLFSSVAANLTADREPVALFPFVVIVRQA